MRQSSLILILWLVLSASIEAAVQAKTCIVDLRPRAESSGKGKYVPIYYETVDANTIRFGIKAGPDMAVYPFRQTTGEISLVDGKWNDVELSYEAPAKAGEPGAIKLKVNDHAPVLNQRTLVPCSASLLMQEPPVRLLKSETVKAGKDKNWLSIDVDGFGEDSGFTISGMNMLPEPIWSAETLRIRSNDAGCIVEPRPKPTQQPLVDKLVDGDFTYATIEYYLGSQQANTYKASFSIQCDVELELAQGRQTKPNRTIVLPATSEDEWNQVELEFRTGSPWVSVSVNGKKEFTWPASVAGVSRLPALAHLGRVGSAGGDEAYDVVDVEFSAFGFSSGFVLKGEKLKIRRRIRR